MMQKHDEEKSRLEVLMGWKTELGACRGDARDDPQKRLKAVRGREGVDQRKGHLCSAAVDAQIDDLSQSESSLAAALYELF